MANTRAGAIPSNLAVAASQSVRWNAAGNAWEAYTPGAAAEVTGVMKIWAGAIATVPAGYLFCNGAAVNRTTYAALFTAIGTNWGSGDGSTTFNIPNSADRFLVGTTCDICGVAKSCVEGSLLQCGGCNNHCHSGSTSGHTHSFSGLTTDTGCASDTGAGTGCADTNYDSSTGYFLTSDGSDCGHSHGLSMGCTDSACDSLTTCCTNNIPVYFAATFIIAI